jgi:hypothetical protein
MTLPLWALELAAEFWQQVGEPEPFPRELHPSIRWAVPLNVDELPHLTLRRALDRLDEQGISWPTAPADVALHGVLLACRGQGFAFIEANDDPAERRFTLAHELAHFLRDYLQPRWRAERLLGPSVLEVLDGDRPASLTERLHAVLRQVPIGHHTHLLSRDAGVAQTRAEQEADLLACELLAPAAVVLARPAANVGVVIGRLIKQFGLPQKQAVRHARRLLPAHGAGYAVLGKWRQQMGV